MFGDDEKKEKWEKEKKIPGQGCPCSRKNLEVLKMDKEEKWRVLAPQPATKINVINPYGSYQENEN